MTRHIKYFPYDVKRVDINTNPIFFQPSTLFSQNQIAIKTLQGNENPLSLKWEEDLEEMEKDERLN